MSNPNAFTCCLIGGDTLLTQCGEILLDQGHRIVHVVTGSATVSAWARRHGLDVVDVADDYAAILRGSDFDYLFAITHLAMIPEAAVLSPRRMAINFHDGPLPGYAGLNTPMWALLNGETAYGITWHVMAAGIDKGDLLLQHPVAISDDDTALSLNTKCFAAALESFPRLLGQLADGSLSLQPQDLSRRSYFGRARRPEGFGLIDWNEPAEVCARLVRALSTGSYENPLASAKVVIGGNGFIVDTAVAIETMAQVPPGTVIEANAEAILVRCGDGALAITDLRDLHGRDVGLAGIATGLEGSTLEFDQTQLCRRAEQIAKAEPAWVRRLSTAEAVTVPFRSGPARVSADASPVRRALHLDLPATRVPGAFLVFLARLLGNESVGLAVVDTSWHETASALAPLAGDFAFAALDVDPNAQISDICSQASAGVTSALAAGPWLRDVIARHPALRDNALLAQDSPLPVGMLIGSDTPAPKRGVELALRVAEDGSACFEYLEAAYDAGAVDRLAKHFEALASSIAEQPTAAFRDVDLLTPEQRRFLLLECNATQQPVAADALMHSDFERQAAATPDAVAVVCGDQQVTYAELDARANRLAAHLQGLGAGTDSLVGVHVPRSVDLMVATIAVLKAGAAYVPLDPAFPADRVAFMIEDSAMPLVVSHSGIRQELPATQAHVICIDEIEPTLSGNLRPDQRSGAGNLAYCIYTSGSTGRPKGVLLEHRNVVNFFAAMDHCVPQADREGRTWLAVTSLSFDISVLELFWTLNRGFKVVVYDESRTRRSADSLASMEPTRVLDMGLFMWGNDDAPGPEKYRLLIEGAKFFDQNGFSAVWTPERHFHAFGGPYPNPAVTGAAVAAVTERVKIRAGSCVVPLHHPVRIAEEWSVVDNLSNGRVEIAAASGWNPNDFVLRPENHADNKGVMYRQLEQVRALWRGEKVKFPGPMGEVAVESLPRPVQPELPCWITTAGNPDTWRDAGRLGLNVLTHLLGQSVEEITEKVRLYREARAEAGHDPATGRVALMLHTFVGEDNDAVRELVREPMKDYLASSMRLAMDYAWSFPAFKRPGGETAKPEDVDLKSLSAEETDTILNFAFERYFETSGLFGDQSTCLRMLARCVEAGVDEIACLLDFGVATNTVMDSLPRLKALRERMVAAAASQVGDTGSYGFGQQVAAHGVTHMQCTPSTARMYLSDAEARQGLAAIDNVMVGGEALPLSLARELKSVLPGTLTNMYGPTETTIWSLTAPIDDLAKGISIGRPIANTRVYVLDRYHKPAPPGVPGELFIGGAGVARGYLHRPELTAERFVQNPFAGDHGARMYATGDLAAFRDDGSMDFFGRTDFQVKVRGYRIELGEIEAQLEALDDVAEAAVIVRKADDGDERMVAFVTPPAGLSPDHMALRSMLRQTLPEYMIPNEFVTVAEMPRTANGKLDRKALQTIKAAPAREVGEDAAPASDLENVIAELWRKTLKLDIVGRNENFFDLGGHSLLVVQLHGQLKQALDRPISLTDLYQYPTIKSLADYLGGGASDATLKKGVSRGERRRALRQRRAS
ncbi:MAG: LLM class flavin-dependent oxidoreductase [Pseudomonadales bacterium]